VPRQAALLAALGAAAGHVYLQLLIRDVDGIGGADGRVAPFLASADSQLSLKSIWCDHASRQVLGFCSGAQSGAQLMSVLPSGVRRRPLVQQTVKCAL
jgi:hypothetical protein